MIKQIQPRSSELDT